MANNYEQILALANKNNMGLSNTIKRDYGIPLDYSSIQESYEAALDYAKNSTLAYIGQPISVGDTLYIVTDKDNDYLKAVGTKPSGDKASIEVAEDGTISLKGFKAAADAYLPQIKVTKDGQGNETNREIEWVDIQTVVRGDGNDNTKTVVTAGTGITVTPKYDAVTDTYTYTLDVTLPTVPAYTIEKTAEGSTTTYQLKKDGTEVGDAIVVPDAYDDSAISADLSAVKSELEEGNYGARIEAIEAFFAAADADGKDTVDPDNPEATKPTIYDALDTLKEIQDYITTDGAAAAQVAANTAAIATLNGAATEEGSVAKAVKDAVDGITGDISDGTTLASLKSDVEANAGNIADNAGAIAELDNLAKFTIDDFSTEPIYDYQYKVTENDPVTGNPVEKTHTVSYSPNDTLIANNITLSEDLSECDPVKKLAILNAAKILHIIDRYLTVDAWAQECDTLFRLIREAEQESIDRDEELEGLIATNTSSIATLNGNASTEGSVAKTVADAIAPLTDETTGIYATAVADAVAAAATDAQNKVDALAAGQVNANTADISAIKNQISGDNGINTSISDHNAKIAALEDADRGLGSRIDALNGTYESLSGTVNGHTNAIKALQDKDLELEAAIAANTSKFDNYSTTQDVQQRINAAVGGIDNSAINAAINENKTAISTEKTRAEAREQELAGLIQSNTDNISTNASNISRIDALLASVITNNDETALNSIKELADWVANHDGENGVLSTVNANKAAIETLNGGANVTGSVAKTVADAISGIPAIEIATDQKAGIVKASDEIGVAGDGAMGILKVSTDKLIQGDLVLVLDGGTAEVATEQPEE